MMAAGGRSKAEAILAAVRQNSPSGSCALFPLNRQQPVDQCSEVNSPACRGRNGSYYYCRPLSSCHPQQSAFPHQTPIPAQDSETAEYFLKRAKVVLTEFRDGLVIGLQSARKLHDFNVSFTFCCKPPANAICVAINMQPTQRRCCVGGASGRFHPDILESHSFWVAYIYKPTNDPRHADQPQRHPPRIGTTAADDRSIRPFP